MQSTTELNTTDQRFIDLETKVSHQDLLLEELHQVIYGQQKTIDALQTQLNIHVKRIQEALLSETPLSHDRPPHY